MQNKNKKKEGVKLRYLPAAYGASQNTKLAKPWDVFGVAEPGLAHNGSGDGSYLLL